MSLPENGSRMPSGSIFHSPGTQEKQASLSLFVDVSIISVEDAGTGIQRVVRAVATRLQPALRDGVRIVPVAYRPGAGYRTAAWGPWQDRTPGQLIQPSEGDVFLGLDLSVRNLPTCDAQFAEWRQMGLRIYLLVHDLLPATNPRWFRPAAVRSFRRWLQFLSRHADGALCVSHSTAEALHGWLTRHASNERRKPRIDVIPLSGDMEGAYHTRGRPQDADALLRWVASAPTILMVGTVEPRKGYDIALKALRRLRASHPRVTINLLIVGRPGWKSRLLQWQIRRTASTRVDVRWLQDAQDELVSELYRACALYLNCSRGEGFGLPVAEALHNGATVVASDLPVFRELFDGKVRFFRRDDPVDLAVALADALDPARVRSRHMRNVHLDPCTATNWTTTTEAILEAIDKDGGQLLTRSVLIRA
ncbi:glycosyltransferase family 4 protein [Sphingomonas azotifigens]|uniref:glycosyltransferase family 4 protein n=1 Tax=Sphingomonas azotifigens TaxID=330920 RepID=UPI00111C4466|nr:glycosyltransferase family 1 protein [Sphingomonas azotifigens]